MNNRSKQASNAWLFFAIALGWSFMFWMAMVVFDIGLTTSPGMALYALGGVGPLLAGVGLGYLTQGREGRQDYWRRVCDIRRIRLRWWAVILFTYPLLNAAALLLYRLSGGELAAFERLRELLAEPLSILPYAAFMLFFGPLPEELGWRGYALDRLQARLPAWSASLALGFFWAAWHLPQFWITGTYQHVVLGWGTAAFWAFLLEILLVSILYTWLFNNTGRSTLAAILFHFMGNFSGELFSLPETARVYRLLPVLLLVLCVLLAWGPENLTRRVSAGGFPVDVAS